MAGKKKGKSSNKDKPTEITMTDLGWTEEGDEVNRDSGKGPERDIHAAGTPGGGTASGGLAGTNAPTGDPDDVDLEDAMGSGIDDSAGEDRGGPPYSGIHGGAVGGTPAEKRASGGHQQGGIAPGGTHRGDSTIGSRSTNTNE